MKHSPAFLRAALLVLALFVVGVAQAQVAVIVNPKNATATMTADQVSLIFLGKQTKFPSGAKAQPVDLSEGAPARDEFYTKVTGKTAAQVKATWSKIVFTGKGQPPKALASSDDVKKFVAANPDAIGYIETAAVDGRVKVVLSVD